MNRPYPPTKKVANNKTKAQSAQALKKKLHSFSVLVNHLQSSAG